MNSPQSETAYILKYSPNFISKQKQNLLSYLDGLMTWLIKTSQKRQIQQVWDPYLLSANSLFKGHKDMMSLNPSLSFAK